MISCCAISSSVPASGIHYRGSTGCFSIDAQGFFSFIWAAPLVVETVLFLLMLYKAWRTYKDEWRSPLLTLLISDRYVSCPWYAAAGLTARYSVVYFLK